MKLPNLFQLFLKKIILTKCYLWYVVGMKYYLYLCIINLKQYNMKSKTLYVVRYNDCYGNGDTSLEVIVKSHEDFKKWLIQHNKERADLQDLDVDDDDFCYEGEEEFELIPLTLFGK